MRKIKTKLLSGICSLTCATCIILGTVSCLILYNNCKQNMADSVVIAADAYTEAVSNSIRIFKAGAQAVATNTKITDVHLTMDERKAELARLSKQFGFKDISVSSDKGQTYEQTDISEMDFFRQAIAGETYVSSPMTRESDGSIVLFVSSPLANDSSHKGVVFASIEPETFGGLMQNIKIGDTGYGFIVDKTGTIVAHKDQEIVKNFTNYIELAKTDTAMADTASMVQLMVAGGSSTGTVDYLGNQQFMGYRPISGTDGWSLGVTANVSEMMAGFYTSLYITIGLIALFILISVVVAFQISTPLARPIAAFTRRLEQLADGDLHTAVPTVKTKDEMEVLGESLRRTVDRMKAYTGDIDRVLSSVSDADLTVVTDEDYIGDFAPIKTSLENIIASLDQTISQIQTASREVSGGSEQMSGGSQILSEGAAEQASAIDRLAVAIGNISKQIYDNAEKAARVSTISNEAADAVDESNRRMVRMLSAIKEINEASAQIGRIIKTIEDIAFQTNILALNAAVEAARAGSAGKGFAVVADEVRSLAGKSAQAAKQTTELIERSTRSVKKGTEIANETANALLSVVESTKQITGLVSEIAAVSKTQSTSVQQVSAGIEQISTVVQNNSATAEESAASGEELSAQAQMLQQLVDRFKLRNGEEEPLTYTYEDERL